MKTRWKKIKQIFTEALELEGSERDRYITEACENEPGLKREVLSLLEAHEHPGALDRPIDAIRLSAISVAKKERMIGMKFGNYKIIRELGYGGMGSVYLAERTDGQFKRKVALKLLHGGLTTDQQVRRFMSERQILASLNHPHIATLLDGGVSDEGQLWFAMEYVDGVPIDIYCDENRLTIKQRLNLFLDVCDAVQFAHGKLVVHRDLKPSNILVKESGKVKLLDFGIAKALDPDSTNQKHDPITLKGILPLTPTYASPEQVLGETVTVSSDTYQLGVILYELLTGFRPYDVNGRTPSEIEQIICRENPTRPSTAITQIPHKRKETGVTPEQIGYVRRESPDQLKKRLHGELDTIILKAMHNEPSRRYDSTEQLAADIRLYLEGRPVLAHPDSRRYRAIKFIKRHTLGFVSSCVIILLLAGYAATITWHSQQTEAALKRAQTEQQKAEQVTGFLMGMFEAGDPAVALGDTVTARVLLDRGTEQAEQLNDQPELQAQMFDVVGQIYSRLGEYEQAEELLERSLAIRKEIHGENNLVVASTKVQLATVFHFLGNYNEAEPLLREALSVQEAHLDSDSPEIASTLSTMGGVMNGLGRYTEAESMLRQSLELQRNAYDTDHLDIAETLNILGLVSDNKGDLEEAEATMREALEMRRNLLSERDPRVLMSLNNLAMLLRKKGDYENAEPVYREALSLKRSVYGEEHPSVSTSLNGLGLLLSDLGDDEAAEKILREALDMRRSLYGNHHPRIAESLNNLGNVFEDQGKMEEAESSIHEARDILARTLGETHPITAYPTIGLARIFMKQERLAEAEPLLLEARTIRKNALPDGHPEIIEVENMFGLCLIQLGKFNEAEEILLEQYHSFEEQGNIVKEIRENTVNHLIRLYEEWDKPQSVELFRDILVNAYSEEEP